MGFQVHLISYFIPMFTVSQIHKNYSLHKFKCTCIKLSLSALNVYCTSHMDLAYRGTFGTGATFLGS